MKTLNTRAGVEKVVSYGDPCWCDLDQCRVRFVRFIGMYVEVMDNNGKVLPDYRHPSQVHPY